MNFLSTNRTHLIRASGDSSSMFVVSVSDLIVRVWLVCIVLTLDFLGFSWRCSWSFFVVPPYVSLCICHLSKWHMMSIHVWTSSVFVFIIVWPWHLYPWPSSFSFLILLKINNRQGKVNTKLSTFWGGLQGPWLTSVKDTLLHTTNKVVPGVCLKRQGIHRRKMGKSENKK